MTLPEVLTTVNRLLGDIGCSNVVIRRDGRELRFEPNVYASERYAVFMRGSYVVTPGTPDPRVFWHAHGPACFTIADVLATDWAIAP